MLSDKLENNEFKNNESPVAFAVGKNVLGNVITCDLEKNPHILLAGITGSGKSMALHCMITSLISKTSPDELRFILIDPKLLEFARYRGMPHLLFDNIIADSEVAVRAVKWLVKEIERRFTLLEQSQCRNISVYNEHVRNGGVGEVFPRIVAVIDELADLMRSDTKKEIEGYIQRITAKGRAVGIHLIIATQRLSADVITGTIKANFCTRMAFRVINAVNSRIILDENGAETLIGNGDMLYLSANATASERVQGVYIDSDEIDDAVIYCKRKYKRNFNNAAEEYILYDEDVDDDEYIEQVVPLVLARAITSDHISMAFIQNRFYIKPARTARILDYLEKKGYIGSSAGPDDSREVLITREQYREIFGCYPEEA